MTATIQPSSVGEATVLALTSNQALLSTTRPTVHVTADLNTRELTVNAGRSHDIINASLTVDFVLVTTGNPNTTIPRGGWARVSWDSAAAQHRVYQDRYVVGGTIDSAVSTSSTNAVTNQAITNYANKVGRVQADDYVITASGNTVTDDGEWDAALTKFTNQGYAGTLWLNGRVRLNASKSWGTMVPSIRALTRGSGIEVMSTAAMITNTAWQIIGTDAGSAISAVSANDSRITSASLALNQGDWVILQSADDIPNLVPHFTSGSTRAGEMHQIGADLGSNVYELFDYVRDPLTTTPKVHLVPIRKQPGLNRSNAVFADFAVYQATGIQVTALFNLFNLDGVTFENINWELNSGSASPGYMNFRNCANVRVIGCDVDGQYGQNTAPYGYGYWCLPGIVNGLTVEDCSVRQTHHAFTTTSGYDSGLVRWGTPLGCRVINSRFYAENLELASLPVLETHPEGYGVVFDGNDIYLPHNTTNYGINFRSRYGVAQNNRVFGSGLGIGLRSQCIGSKFINNIVQNCWYGIRVSGYKSGVPIDNVKIHGNHIQSTYSNAAGIETSGGVGYRITNNAFVDMYRGILVTGAVSNPASDWTVAHNTFANITSTGHGAIDFEDTGGGSAADVAVLSNAFHGCAAELLVCEGSGNNISFIGNSQENCSASKYYVRIEGGTGHEVRNNDLGKRSNTGSVDVGTTINTTDIKIRGNTTDGYGVGSLGLTGTNAAAIDAQEDPYNWHD